MFSMASSMSPLASVSAFLQSIMPAAVRSRSSLTRAAEMFAMSFILGLSDLYKNAGVTRTPANQLQRVNKGEQRTVRAFISWLLRNRLARLELQCPARESR